MNKIDNLDIELLKPANKLLTQGGDSRIVIGGENKLNSYGSSTFPQYTIAYSSCTSNTISPSAYAYAEAYLHRVNKLISESSTNLSFFGNEFERIRAKISEFYEIPSDVSVVLGSSGTDLELIMLAASLSSGKPIHNIVLGANEVGSGIEFAAQGRYFSNLTPLGNKVKVGDAIPGFDQENISYYNIEIRNSNGSVRDELDIISDYEEQVEWAIANGKKALIHAIHRSKTGLIFPSFNNLKYLKEKYQDNVYIVIDACQGRISIRLVNEYLNLGAAVLFTGSKFYSGPAFSGALLLPHNLIETIKQGKITFSGLAHFFTRYEFPNNLEIFGEWISNKINIGLLLRWTVAIYEMNKVFLVPNKRIEFVINTFNSVARKMIQGSDFLQEVNLSTISEEDVHPENTKSPFEINTIITFKIESPHSFLDIDDAKLINQAMYSDLTNFLATDSKYASILMQLGQPVKVSINESLNKWNASLRIALSSSHIGELGLLDDYIIQMRFESDFDMIHEKLRLIIDNMDTFRKKLG